MPREHGRVLSSIWRDDDFRDLTVEGQRLYVLLLSQPNVNNAGVLPMMVSKWAKGSKHTTPDDIYRALIELSSNRFILFDDETEEVFIRSYMRNDGVLKQPNILKNALRCVKAIESFILRMAASLELRRLGRRDTEEVADFLDPENQADAVVRKAFETHPELLLNPLETLSDFGNPSETLSEPLSKPAGWGRGKGRGESLAEQESSFTDVKTPTTQAPKNEYTEEFQRWWSTYPRRDTGKADAAKAYAKARKIADAETLLDGAARYAQDPNLPEIQFVPHGARWLNGKRWEDGPCPPRADRRPTGGERANKILEMGRALAAEQQQMELQ